MNEYIEVMSRKQAAQFLGVCLTTLDRLDIPRTQVRKRVLFRKTTLEKWLDENTVPPVQNLHRSNIEIEPVKNVHERSAAEKGDKKE